MDIPLDDWKIWMSIAGVQLTVRGNYVTATLGQHHVTRWSHSPRIAGKLAVEGLRRRLESGPPVVSINWGGPIAWINDLGPWHFSSPVSLMPADLIEIFADGCVALDGWDIGTTAS